MFGLVIGAFTLGLSRAVGDRRAGSGHRSSTRCSPPTSASTVTGLVVVPTGEYWSALGLVVILVAIQIGGLGVMTLASLLGIAVSRRIGLTQRLLVRRRPRRRGSARSGR